MISVSTDYKNAIASSKEWQERVVFTLAGGSTLVATNMNIWEGGLSIEDTVSDEGTFEIGSTHINQVTITLYNGEISEITNVDFNLDSEGCLIMDGETVSYQAVYDNVDFTDATVEVYVGLPGYTLIQKGIYVVSDYTKDDGVVNVVCYDYMHKFSRGYDINNDIDITFPTTLGTIVATACANCGVTLATPNFNHYDLVISQKPTNFGQLTYREMIGYAAMISVGFARCNRQGQLEIKWYDSNAVHTIPNMYSHHEGEFVTITGVRLNQRYVYETSTVLDDGTIDTSSGERDVDLYHGTDTYRVSLEYNPLIEMANAQTICNWIGTAIEGMQFTIYDLNCPSDFTIEAGDVATVTNNKNQTAHILVSRVTFGTGDSQNIQCNAPRPSQTKIVRPSNYAQSYEDLKAQIARQQELRQATSAGIAESAEDAKKKADNYLSADSSGVMIADLRNGEQTPLTATGRNTLIDNTSVNIRNGQTVLASFSEEIVLGRPTVGHAYINYHSLQLRDASNNAYLHVSDLRDQNGFVTITEEETLDSSANPHYYDVSFSATVDANLTALVFKINGTALASSEFYASSKNSIRVPNYDLRNKSIYVQYRTDSRKAISLTFGYRKENTTIGPASIAIGIEVESSGRYSFAEGYQATAKGIGSHAEGLWTSATGDRSHSEGSSTTGSGYGSHAEGVSTDASGYASHAQNYRTVAASDSQTAIGKYNKTDSSNKYLFIIGNGYATDDRRNAFAVTQEGTPLSGSTSLSLGRYVTGGVLTGSGGTLQFCIPTGRVFPSGTTVSKMSFKIIARASNSDGTGYYIVKDSAGGTSYGNFYYDPDDFMQSWFYDANDSIKDFAYNAWTVSVQGGTNIYISISGATDLFTGTSAIRAKTNNNAVSIYLADIAVTLSNPFQN